MAHHVYEVGLTSMYDVFITNDTHFVARSNDLHGCHCMSKRLSEEEAVGHGRFSSHCRGSGQHDVVRYDADRCIGLSRSDRPEIQDFVSARASCSGDRVRVIRIRGS